VLGLGSLIEPIKHIVEMELFYREHKERTEIDIIEK